MRVAEIFSQKIKEIKYPQEDTSYKLRIEALKKQIEDITVTHKASLFAKRQVYRDEINKINEAFKLALFKEYGVETNPKREQVFSKAWEEGHSTGYDDVEIYFSDFVDLIK